MDSKTATDVNSPSVQVFDSNIILHSYFQISMNKYVESSLAMLIYKIVVGGTTSFQKTSEVMNDSLAQTASEMSQPNLSHLHSPQEQQAKLPDSLGLVGKGGISAVLTEKDIEAVFWKYAAALRAERLGQNEIVIPAANHRTSFVKQTTSFANQINKYVEAEGFYLAKPHCCTDCTTNLLADHAKCISSIVLDGVTATCPIFAEPGCCCELENTTIRRYCDIHFAEHFRCGVRKGPSNEGRCTRLVADVTEEEAIQKSRAHELPTSMACLEHAHVEAEYNREHGTQGRESYLIALRAADVRGKTATKASKKRAHPELSDHCKSSWAAMEKSMPVCDTVKEYTVSFRRAFAYVYCAVLFPCGIAVYGDFFGDSESPTEIVKLVLKLVEKGYFPKMPGVIYFDAACKALRSLLSPVGVLSHLKSFFAGSMWLVPPLHVASHKKTDAFCQTCCDPKAATELYRDKTYRFNGSVCEDKFAILGGFDSMVRSMQKIYASALFSVYFDESNSKIDGIRRVTGKHFHDLQGARVDGKSTSHRNPSKASRL